MPKRRSVILGMLILGAIVIAGVGFSGEASAQVFQGPMVFTHTPSFVFTMTVTLQPSGPARYNLTFLSHQIDQGLLVAEVRGSSVSGFIQSTTLAVRPCSFQGSYNGTVATLSLDPTSCGDGGTLTLTRIQ